MLIYMPQSSFFVLKGVIMFRHNSVLWIVVICKIFLRLTDFKGRWLRKMSGVGKNTVIQFLSAIVAIGGYFKFERVLSL
jgi:hypothetical protein